MVRILKVLGLGVLLLLAVLAFNTWRYAPTTTETPQGDLPQVNAMDVAQKLSQAIQFKTISHPFGDPDRPESYDQFLAWLGTAFPAATQTMDRVLVGGHTPIYVWKGSDPTAETILVSGHYDVVPIEGEWSTDPWAGTIKDGYVWGRGALDMKGAVVSLLHAIDQLAATGFQPRSTIYVAITQDEEIGGDGGAASVVDYFQKENIKIDWSLDEGSFVLRDIISTIDKDIASINVAEKGYMTVEIIARGAGGHSSLPHRDTAVTKLATAITELHAAPIPGGLTGLSADFFDTLGPHMTLPERVLFANQWLFRPLIEGVLSGANTTDAMLRTTTAPTMLKGSEAENILPQKASAFVNFRLHPRDDQTTVLQHLKRHITNDHIDIEVVTANPASPVASHSNAAFASLSNAARHVFGDVVIVPGLTVGGTDSSRYSQYADHSYRFLPFVFTSEDIALLHGRDERISIKNLERAVQYYKVLLGGL